mgnify:CR=1 FL=1
MAYAELGKQTLRVGVSQTANPVLSQNTVVPGGARGGGGRNRGGSQPGQAGAAPAVQVPMVGRRMLQEAKQYYGEATKLNPASAELHLQAAVVAAMIGDWKMVQEMVDRASEIDGATRHLDRKIDAAKIWVPRAMVPVIESQAKRGGRLNEEENEDWKGFKQLNDRNESVPGEPVYRLLRSLLKRS